jgi:hypothetical protein
VCHHACISRRVGKRRLILTFISGPPPVVKCGLGFWKTDADMLLKGRDPTLGKIALGSESATDRILLLKFDGTQS